MLDQKKIDKALKFLDNECFGACNCIRVEARGCDCNINKARLILLDREDMVGEEEEEVC